MADCAHQPIRITDKGLDQQGEKGQRDGNLRHSVSHAAPAWRRSRRRAAAVSRTRRNLSSTCRPGSIRIPIRCRNCRPSVFARLPEPAALERLAAIAARAYGAPSAGPRGGGAGHADPAAAGGRAGAAGPRRRARADLCGACARRRARRAPVRRRSTDIRRPARDADLAVVVNPNNPDGRIVGKDALLALADEKRRRGGLLVVDEAFMDVGPAGLSLGPEVGRGNIVVLRSFGKFFGLAGLRLGFALAAPELAARLRATLGPWAVAGPAIAIGQAALADAAWAEAMRDTLARDAARLDRMLAGRGAGDRRRHVAVPAGADAGGRARCSIISAAPASWCAASPRSRHGCGSGCPAIEADWQRLAAALADFAVSTEPSWPGWSGHDDRRATIGVAGPSPAMTGANVVRASDRRRHTVRKIKSSSSARRRPRSAGP